MKKGLLCFLAIALTMVGCQNYDDQFNDLNTQISALSSQVAGLSQVQTDLSALAATVASLQSSVDDNGTALAGGLGELQEQIDALESQLSEVASSEDVSNINESLDGVKEDLNDLLASSNVFNGDLTINSVATLEFAQSLDAKVGIINGNVTIELNADMDAEATQNVAKKIRTITKDLKVRALNSSLPAIVMDSLTGVNDVYIAQGGSIEFPKLKSAGDVTIGNNYESKLTGTVDFGVLTQVKSFNTGTIETGYSITSEEANTIGLSKMTSLNLGSLGYYAPRSLTINGDEDTAVNLSSLQSVDVNGANKTYTVVVEGASALNIPGLVLGAVTVTDVKDVVLEAFSGTFTLNDGVENVTVGALKNDFNANGKKDLETLNLTMDAADKMIDLTDAEGLKSASISGAVKAITLVNNNDLITLEISAAVETLTVSDTNLSEVNLAYTNANLAEKGKLIITDNDDLVSFSADNVDGLAELTITGNKDLENISFDALQVVPTKVGVNPMVEIGGTGKANAFNATSIIQDGVGSADGDFTTSSGLDDLKTYLTAAASNAAAELKVFFDSADDFSDGTTDDTNLKISEAGDVARLTVINRDSSGDAVKAKRAFVVNTIQTTSTDLNNLNVNGTVIDWVTGDTNADFTTNLFTPANIAQLSANGVSLTVNTFGNPTATAEITQAAATTITGVGSATEKANAEKIKLTVGDHAVILYLSTEIIDDVTTQAFTSTNTTSEISEVTDGATSVSGILTLIASEFNSFSPYEVTLATKVLTIKAKDKSDAKHKTAVSFELDGNINFTGFVNADGVTSDDELIGEAPLIIIESDVAGATLSNIGNPITSVGTASDSVGDGDATLDISAGTSGDAIELYNHPTEIAASNSVTNLGVDATTGSANTNNVSWLAG